MLNPTRAFYVFFPLPSASKGCVGLTGVKEEFKAYGKNKQVYYH